MQLTHSVHLYLAHSHQENRSLHAQFHLFILPRSYTVLTHRTFFQLRRHMHAGHCRVVRCVWRFANWKMSCVIRCLCVCCFADWKNVLCHEMCIVARMDNTSEARVSRSYIIRTLLSVDIFRNMIFYKWTRKMSWQALSLGKMSCVMRCVYSPVHRHYSN